MAVHRGGHKRDNTRITRELERDFFSSYPKARTNGNLVALNKVHFVESHFKQGIAAYVLAFLNFSELLFAANEFFQYRYVQPPISFLVTRKVKTLCQQDLENPLES